MNERRRLLQLRTQSARHQLRDDRGMATAELAIGLVALALVVQVLASAGSIVVSQLQVADAARIAVRLAARGRCTTPFGIVTP